MSQDPIPSPMSSGFDDSSQTCIPCRLATAPLSEEEAKVRWAELPKGWQIENGAFRLKRCFRVQDFAQALQLVNRIGAVAEALNHHPDIAFGWGWVEVILWTHKVNGLTDADFVLARRIEAETRA